MEMCVTAIEPYPKGKGRVAIYLNDKFAFVLYKGELSQYSLEQGVTVDDELYRRILDGTLIPRAKKRGMNLLKTMDRTEYDIRHKLSEGGYPEEAVDVTVSWLKSYHYIDDMRYACEFIRFRSRTDSQRAIITKLSQKGVAKSVIEEAFRKHAEEYGEEAESAETVLLRKLIMKRCPDGAENLDYAGRQKLYAYLYGKGFSMTAIEDAVRQCCRSTNT